MMLLASPGFSPLPGGTPLERIARLVWCASQELLHAARTGQRAQAGAIGAWLCATASAPACPARLARTIDRTMDIARTHLGGVAPAFEPCQGDDGEAA